MITVAEKLISSYLQRVSAWK